MCGLSPLADFTYFFKKFSSLVERGKIYQRNQARNILSVPLVVAIKQTNEIDLRVCRNINQSAPQGQILTLLSA